MDVQAPQGKAAEPAARRCVPKPANNNRPTSLRLDEVGLTASLLDVLFELVSVASCYAPDKRSRQDLRAAAGHVADAANRLRRATLPMDGGVHARG